MSKAPLGPIRTIPARGVTYYLDQLGRDYNSIEHVLRCAIAEALNVVRS